MFDHQFKGRRGDIGRFAHPTIANFPAGGVAFGWANHMDATLAQSIANTTAFFNAAVATLQGVDTQLQGADSAATTARSALDTLLREIGEEEVR